MPNYFNSNTVPLGNHEYTLYNFTIDVDRSNIGSSAIANLNNPHDIIFINFTEKKTVEQFVLKKYDAITKIYRKVGKNFIYLEKELTEIFQLGFQKVLSYNYPNLNEEKIKEFKKFADDTSTTFYFTKQFFSQLKLKSESIDKSNEDANSPQDLFSNFRFGLLRHIGGGKYSYADISTLPTDSYISFFTQHASSIPELTLIESFSSFHCDELDDTDPDDYADDNFPIEAGKIAKKISDNIKLMRQNGYTQLLLQIIAQSLNSREIRGIKTPSQTHLSPVHISADFKIYLPDFHNMEIKMTPLPKTIFFFFLKHPEGILFKSLRDHRNELLQLYQQFAYNQDLKKIEESVNRITNSRQNAANEKCSRIKEAFIQKMEENIASNYYVNAGRRDLKYIRIARIPKMLHWDKLPDVYK